MMNERYRAFFERNLGVLTGEEQKRVAGTRVAVIGDSGTADVISTVLARMGFTDFILAGGDSYVPSDMNRQICCFTDTVGRRKLDVTSETLRRINPAIRITEHDHLPEAEEMEYMIRDADIVIPALDNLALSVLLFRAARKLGKTTVFCLPTGTAGWVSVFTKDTPTLEAMLGIPSVAYRILQNVIRTKEYRCAQYHYITDGNWRMDWFVKYFNGMKPLALFCPVQWTLASLAAQEALKIATGRWKPMEAPRCWRMKKGRLFVSRFSFFIRAHRKLGWFLFGSDEGLRRHRLTHFFWKKLFQYFRGRESRGKTLPTARG